MSAKNIFIIILVVALIGIGVVAYRSSYTDDVANYDDGMNKPVPVVPQTNIPTAGQATPVETSTNPSAPTTAPDKTVAVPNKIIEYGGSGFSPTPVTVKVGTTVVFMNESDVDMWVASAPHPTHTDYPEFDAKRAIKPGQSYAFTFMKIGAWKYHNHFNPSQFGSVVVTE